MYVSISERIEAPYGVLIRISAVVSGANTLKKNALFERDIVGRGINSIRRNCNTPDLPAENGKQMAHQCRRGIDFPTGA